MKYNTVPIAIDPDTSKEVLPKDAEPKKSYKCSSVACSTEVRRISPIHGGEPYVTRRTRPNPWPPKRGPWV